MAWNGDTSGGVAVVLEVDGRDPHAGRAGERAHQAGLARDVAVAHRLESGRRDLEHDALAVGRPPGHEGGERQARRTARQRLHVGDGAPRRPGLRGGGRARREVVEVRVRRPSGRILSVGGVRGHTFHASTFAPARASYPAVSPVAVPSLQHRSADELDLRRVRRGRGFSYHRPDGSRVKDAATLERIRGIVIPPAWTDVRISDIPTPTSRPWAATRGRLQYRYHPDWTDVPRPGEVRPPPAVRQRHSRRCGDRIDTDLALTGMTREKVLATVVELLQTTLIRVGNDEYARDNGAYGLTTFRNRHAQVSGAEIAFVFTGKSGMQHEVHAQDRRVARGAPQCQEIPGQRLFQYLDDDGAPRAGPLPRRERLPPRHRRRRHHRQGLPHLGGDRDRSGRARSARTPEPGARRAGDGQGGHRRSRQDLGNTPTVSRASYMHPRAESFATGALAESWSTTPPRRAASPSTSVARRRS